MPAKLKPHCYLGIDPGITGALAVIYQNTVAYIFKFKDVEDYEIFLQLRGLTDHYNVKCVLEQVHAMPGHGVTSMFTFGEAVGKIKMALAAADINYLSVTPQKWQEELGCLTPRKAPRKQKQKQGKVKRVGKDKSINLAKAVELFPNVKMNKKTADAVLLAEYCRRIYQGKSNGGS